jgi:hypothetical protein
MCTQTASTAATASQLTERSWWTMIARQNQVNVRVIPISVAVGESIELAHDIYSRVFRKMPKTMEKVH